jgi:hypothetical protein
MMVDDGGGRWRWWRCVVGCGECGKEKKGLLCSTKPRSFITRSFFKEMSRKISEKCEKYLHF